MPSSDTYCSSSFIAKVWLSPAGRSTRISVKKNVLKAITVGWPDAVRLTEAHLSRDKYLLCTYMDRQDHLQKEDQEILCRRDFQTFFNNGMISHRKKVMILFEREAIVFHYKERSTSVGLV